MKNQNGLAGLLTISLVVVAIIITSVVFISRPPKERYLGTITDSAESGTILIRDPLAEEKETPLEESLTPTVIDKNPIGQTAELLDFKKADYDTAVAGDQLVVLYFYANWCPICRAEFPKMQAAFETLKTDKVIGFRVNYNDSDTDDAERALAREFGVAYQHTKVFLKNGNRVLKAPDSWSKDRYLEEISKGLSDDS